MSKQVSLLWFVLALGFDNVYALDITHVYHVPETIDSEKGEHADIGLTLSQQADVEINIYDDRDVLVNVMKQTAMTPGDHKIKWSGKDQAGKALPPEAYHYTITAKGMNGEVAEHDISDNTGRENISADDIVWHEVTNHFAYSLAEPSRVLMRVGIKSGPLLKNVVNWEPRARGKQTEQWDGKDASKILDLAKHPNMDIQIQAYTLSKNTIIVTGKPQAQRYLKTADAAVKRVAKKSEKKRMLETHQQSPETRGDYPAKLEFLRKLSTNADGVEIVTDKVPMMVSVADQYKNIVLTRRMEPVIFIDGQFAFENEVGFLPMTWLLDASQYNEGLHYISVNLRGYEGNFGIATKKFFVKHSKQK